MFVKFEELPQNSRVWYYQADRELSSSEISAVTLELQHNINSWVTHGMPMKGSFKILYNRIILISADVDYQSPSGCSIDSSTRWLKNLGEELKIDFFDRSVGYFKDQKLEFFSVYSGKKLIEAGAITEDTKLVNHQILSLESFDSEFYITAKQSFLKRHFVVETGVL